MLQIIDGAQMSHREGNLKYRRQNLKKRENDFKRLFVGHAIGDVTVHSFDNCFVRLSREVRLGVAVFGALRHPNVAIAIAIGFQIRRRLDQVGLELVFTTLAIEGEPSLGRYAYVQHVSRR